MNVLVIDGTLPAQIPTLYEGPALDLPAGAVMNEDGSVILTLDYPKTLRFSSAGQVREEPIDSLVFHRMSGSDGRRIINAKNQAVIGFAASARMTPGRSNLILNVLDAADGMAAGLVVTELLGGAANGGLPDHAVSSPDGVKLDLLFAVTGEDGTEYTDMFFPRMTVAERNKAQAATDILDFVTGQVTGLTPKLAHDLLDKMDAADVRSVYRVIGFLFGAGR